jgi:hypothetical protein
MTKHPHDFTRAQWNEKVGDLRNFTFLLDAMLTDIGIS